MNFRHSLFNSNGDKMEDLNYKKERSWQKFRWNKCHWWKFWWNECCRKKFYQKELLRLMKWILTVRVCMAIKSVTDRLTDRRTKNMSITTKTKILSPRLLEAFYWLKYEEYEFSCLTSQQVWFLFFSSEEWDSDKIDHPKNCNTRIKKSRWW